MQIAPELAQGPGITGLIVGSPTILACFLGLGSAWLISLSKFNG